MKFTPLHSSSKGNLYVIEGSAGSKLLLEAGLSFKKIQKAMNFKLSGIEAVFSSHYHADHAKGLKDLMKHGIDAYVTRDTAKALDLSGHRLHTIRKLSNYYIKEFVIVPFPVKHCEGSVGFLIQDETDKMVFAIDTHYVEYKFYDLTIIAIECNYDKRFIDPTLDKEVRKRIYESHFEIGDVIKFLEANDLRKVKEIHLLHLSRANSREDDFRRRIMELTGIPTFIAKE